MKILILGAYGIFGGRLCQLLAEDTRLELIIAGRSLARAEKWILGLADGALKTAMALDRHVLSADHLRALKVDLVVDATGPFQLYDRDPYHVLRSCIEAKVNYLDLADASDFVRGVDQLDEEAKAAGVFLLTGVSSFPVLTAAVTRRLSQDFTSVKTICAGIAPSPYAVVGLNVLRAITSYAGKPVRLRTGGQDAYGIGLVDTREVDISVAGLAPLGRVRFSLVDVPDLQVLPQLWPEVEDVWVGAGPVPELLHRVLNGLAALVQRGILSSLLPFAPLFHFVWNRLHWGRHRGGMFVTVTGQNQNGEVQARTWNLIAEGEDGPLIPSMGAQAIILRMLNGKMPVSGARCAASDLELSDYESLFQSRLIKTAFK